MHTDKEDYLFEKSTVLELLLLAFLSYIGSPFHNSCQEPFFCFWKNILDVNTIKQRLAHIYIIQRERWRESWRELSYRTCVLVSLIDNDLLKQCGGVIFFFNTYFFCVSVAVHRWKRVPGLGTTRHLTEAGVRYADDWRRLKTIQIWSENATGTPPLFLTHEAPMTINNSSYCTCLYVWVCWNIHIEYTIGSCACLVEGTNVFESVLIKVCTYAHTH